MRGHVAQPAPPPLTRLPDNTTPSQLLLVILYRVGAAPGEVVAGGRARVLRVVPGAPLRTRGLGHVRLQCNPQSGRAAT